MLPNIGLIVLLSFQSPISPIVINEVMANPKGSSGIGYPEDRNEFVELFNISAEPVDIRGWRITDFDATDSIIAWHDTAILSQYPDVIINSTVIPGNNYALILDPEYTSLNAAGGYREPYYFPDSLLILTVGNTTIGNELQNNDPLLLYSFTDDSSTFGTPFDFADSFPDDAGDGISWERNSPYVADARESWIRSIDTSGSTPGRINSTLTYYDLSVVNMYSTPTVVDENNPLTISVVISNIGYQSAYCWNFTIFNDKNKNNIEDVGERLCLAYGMPLSVDAETTISYVWNSVPAGEHLIWAKVDFIDDKNLSNNAMSKTISTLPTIKKFGLVKNIFSPDNDGIDDSLMVQYNFSESNGKLSILVYDLNGRLIRKLIDQKIYNKSGIVAWDGDNINNQPAPIGIYIIYLEYKTANSTIKEKTSAILAKKRD